MKNNNQPHHALAVALSLALSAGACSSAVAGITLYDNDGTTFSADGLINTFYVNSDIDDVDNSLDRQQARVKMGFLPNWIGFNMTKQAGDLKLGARSSFWVSINDSDPVRASSAGHGVTDTGIDVRQFYGTVDGTWGQLLIGKDFSLFGRANIFGDELLKGYGQAGSDGLVDGANVSFGNIGTGYLYPFPNSQITWRSPTKSGLQLAVGIMDPNKSAVGSEEDSPRLEAELTWQGSFDKTTMRAWLGGMTQESSNTAGDVNANGLSYGANIGFGGLSLTASGFDAEGVGTAGLANFVSSDSGDVSGYLLQASYTLNKERFVLSYGENDGGTTAGANDLDAENTALAWFHSVNDNLKLVAEIDRTETPTRETDTVAIGAVLSW